MRLRIAFLFALIVAASCSFAQQSINWVTLEQAQELMKTNKKKVIVDVYTSWCGPCKMMMSSTFTNPHVVKYINDNYYAVKFNAEGPEPVTFRGKEFTNEQYDPNRRGRNGTHQLTGAIAAVNGRIAYPTLVYMDEDFNILSPVQGFMKPADLEPILKYIQSGLYKDTKFADWKTGSFKQEWL